jgi:hypothetical protein
MRAEAFSVSDQLRSCVPLVHKGQRVRKGRIRKAASAKFSRKDFPIQQLSADAVAAEDAMVTPN